MGFNQYHEPAGELSEETRTFARLMASLTEEAEAIGWYEQRLSVEADAEARAVMAHAQHEEFIHFGIDLELLMRKKPIWRQLLKNILFKKGALIELAEHAEDNVLSEGNGSQDGPTGKPKRVDKVTEASKESFPASDPPAWTK